MVKDLMILRIISDSQWKYPIYFAVTVPGSNRLGLEEFLERLDGVQGVGIAELTEDDIIRNKIISRILDALYD